MPEHHERGEAVVQLGLLGEASEVGREPVERRDRRARAPREDRRQSEVVDVLVGDHEQADFLDGAAVRGQRLLELVERLGRVGPGVDQRERVVLDQIGVDAPDLKRRGDRQPVDPELGGARQRGLVCLRRRLRLAHERITASTSSRRRSMSSRETSDSRQRRSSGSVFDGRTLKCQSS